MMLKNRIMENSSHLKMERRRRRIEAAAAEDRATKKYTIYTTSQQGNQRDLGRAGFAEHFCHGKHLGLTYKGMEYSQGCNQF